MFGHGWQVQVLSVLAQELHSQEPWDWVYLSPLQKQLFFFSECHDGEILGQFCKSTIQLWWYSSTHSENFEGQRILPEPLEHGWGHLNACRLNLSTEVPVLAFHCASHAMFVVEFLPSFTFERSTRFNVPEPFEVGFRHESQVWNLLCWLPNFARTLLHNWIHVPSLFCCLSSGEAPTSWVSLECSQVRWVTAGLG